MRVAVIGAGAAGCFCSIELKRRLPEARVDVLEKGSRPLAKVAVTGGGRCNLTNSFEGISSLAEAYPRGDKLMRKVFRSFSPEDTVKWFEDEGVELVLQDDHCYFPASQDAMQIVSLLLQRMRQLGVNVLAGRKVDSIRELFGEYDSVVVAPGGLPKPEGYSMFDGLDLEIVPPVPSLFTFNLPGSPVRELMGTVVEDASDYASRVLNAIDNTPAAGSGFVLTEDGYIHIALTQREPVIRFQDGNNGFYADASGFIFPLQSRFCVRVPIVDGELPLKVARGFKGDRSDDKWLMQMLGMASWMESSPWDGIISQISVNADGDIVLIPREGRERFIFGSPDRIEDKLRLIRRYYEAIKPNTEKGKYAWVDVRQKGQIVCR